MPSRSVLEKKMTSTTQCAECGGTIYNATPNDEPTWVHAMTKVVYCPPKVARPVA
jgi:hypothetical protein